MKIVSTEFVIGVARLDQLPGDGLPEVALAGRSNVGKSSLINRMLNRKNLARTSAQPGKTQQLNFYRVNGEMYFVDFPGYGYAKVSQKQREKWGRLIESYIRGRKQLKLQLLIVDLRHPPTGDDKLMYDWLRYYGIPTCVVATKADKVPRTRRERHLRAVRETLGLDDGVPLVLFSAETGEGRDELWNIVRQAIAG
ncbi:MAG: YihA family ribosome biogenesis GTP-binding protein [Thermobacillus sp. ZCTH02-B1]|uniref:ribosome biogenesis GTP-binding protein YihA/YsxC n=1 Tax=Thermobacillus sp. ZCTH02-B1 TaxID=1858795 RepID=UPI000B57D34C|nr:ribosome biogenesis GTP-binding protein YihA/YsxC [Thermobacillus sp. ZCTH02-B1]OUM96111.1 MAG: YihA family ribosome biogenesis GTP-binding protein [Thermobacillus sp. ZCTH02-B1]